jgi:hypothetical protein
MGMNGGGKTSNEHTLPIKLTLLIATGHQKGVSHCYGDLLLFYLSWLLTLDSLEQLLSIVRPQ